MIQSVIARYATSGAANLVAIACLFCAGCASGWYFISNVYEAKISEIERTQAEEIASKAEHERESLISYANRIAEVQNEHEENTRIIDNLRASNKRLRVNFPAAKCEGDQTDPDSNVSSRLLSEKISDEHDRVQEQNRELIIAADKLNAEAIRANGLIEAYAELCGK